MADDVNLFDYINDLRKESRLEHEKLHKRVSDMKDELLAEMKSIRAEQSEINSKMEERVTNLERWKWSIIGGSAVLGFFLAGGIEAIGKFLQ